MTPSPPTLPDPLRSALQKLCASQGQVVILTGAGISAESGIPTFRGKDGFWRVGSRNYQPTEMATHATFCAMPEEVWAWYLYRRASCLAASPNAAHHALVTLERALEDRYLLITQNVDGLHLRAGSSPGRTYEIHGNISFMRCAEDCTPSLQPMPPELDANWSKERKLTQRESALLRCRECGAQARPHVLWFDECYDEYHYRFESSLRAAAIADLLVVVGTTGATNLPRQIGAMVASRGAAMVVINPEQNAFTDYARELSDGYFLEGTAGQWVLPLCAQLAEGA